MEDIRGRRERKGERVVKWEGGLDLDICQGPEFLVMPLLLVEQIYMTSELCIRYQRILMDQFNNVSTIGVAFLTKHSVKLH